MSVAFPTVNGIAPSWADIETTFSVLGGGILDTEDYSAINFSDTLEIGNRKGASGGRVKKRTTGSVDQEASLTMYQAGAKALHRALMQAAPLRAGQRAIGLVAFNILVQLTPPGETEIYTIEIRGCRVAGRTWAMAEGTDANVVEVPLSVAQIVELIDGEEVVLL
jgi:hypothetical protein